MSSKLNLGDWDIYLQDEFKKDYMQKLKIFLQHQKQKNKQILPATKHWFYAFQATQLANLKVVIVGQDPYPTPEYAHGLCFSVQDGVALPASLLNIFAEITQDIGLKMSKCGNLEAWTKQGVLLLNSVLTVNSHQPNSHQGQGWEQFSDKVIRIISEQKKHIVFLLWGRYAQQKRHNIDEKKHLILTATHPSPLSAYRGFFGCKHFSKTNTYLKEHNIKEIAWQLEN